MFDFESYHVADTPEDAVKLLIENPNSRLLAGGTDILVRLHEGDKAYRNLVDIHQIDQLKQIAMEADGTIVLGSGTCFNQVAGSEIVLKYIPVLAEGASSIGGPQVRNSATIGGNICNGAPSGDSAAPLLVLNAEVSLLGPKGIRRLPLEKFYLGPSRVDLKPAEIMTDIRIAPEQYQGLTAHFYKYAMRKAMDIATIGCAAACRLAEGKLLDFRLAFTVAGPTPLRCPKTEKKLTGMPLNQQMIE
ncbi:MAG: xanthine dehydrogenase FAD-binding subunit XdhB, partial [Deltaproteobacteria bacterium]|nr:xanthine dehydrogenase FAD-binding subunit XdhB [Deltaproteobacteria bacterium]